MSMRKLLLDYSQFNGLELIVFRCDINDLYSFCRAQCVEEQLGKKSYVRSKKDNKNRNLLVKQYFSRQFNA